VGLLIPFYHNFLPVNKKFRRVLGGDFSDPPGSDCGFKKAVEDGNYRFKYSQIRENHLKSSQVVFLKLPSYGAIAYRIVEPTRCFLASDMFL
jgi:hypothetical protein